MRPEKSRPCEKKRETWIKQTNRRNEFGNGILLIYLFLRLNQRVCKKMVHFFLSGNVYVEKKKTNGKIDKYTQPKTQKNRKVFSSSVFMLWLWAEERSRKRWKKWWYLPMPLHLHMVGKLESLMTRPCSIASYLGFRQNSGCGTEETGLRKTALDWQTHTQTESEKKPWIETLNERVDVCARVCVDFFFFALQLGNSE